MDVLTHKSIIKRLSPGRDQLLSKLRPLPMEEYNRQTCFENTRLEVIDSIISWFADDSAEQKPVLWLYGLAGSGKSTISTTIAHIFRGIKRLGGVFYFDRALPERNAAALIRTLAYRLASSNTHIYEHFTTIVGTFDDIAQMTLEVQFGAFLSSTAFVAAEQYGGPVLLVIDALEECGTEKNRESLLSVLSAGFSKLASFIRIIILSRPEPDIERALGSHPCVRRYHLDIDSEVNKKDITLYLRQRLSEIRERRLPLEPDWPVSGTVDTLAQQAAGLFVYASTACLYIDQYDPKSHLDDLLQQDAVVASSETFATADNLYEIALQVAGSWNNASFTFDYLRILGAVLCAREPLSCSTVDSILALSRPSLQCVAQLSCVIRWRDTDGIRTLHPSFRDYLTVRCRSKPWFINIADHNRKLAIHCIDYLDGNLHENICGLSIQQLVWDASLPEALSYACRFWIEHVTMISNASRALGDRMYIFLGDHMLHWIEALALLKRNDVTILLLQSLLIWLKVCPCNPNDIDRAAY